MKIDIFNNLDFLSALKYFFRELNLPVNYVTDEPVSANEILKDTYKANETFQLIDDVYFVGMVDNDAFNGNESLEVNKIKSDYDGILIFGIKLNERPNNLLPTRSQLADISRAFNREYYYTPVVIVFKYGTHIAFSSTERLKFKQEWREGEKAGKVSLLRDINIEKPHPGHISILSQLKLPKTGSKQVNSFASLYAYWEETFSVALLNKKFYQELSNWHLWATRHVVFPGAPTLEDAHLQKIDLDDLLQEHRATNVIRMLTRLLFVWFIKEKKLIPEELFEPQELQKNILKEISPYNEIGLLKEANRDSVYYKAILQNLFFATLNCPIKSEKIDKRERGFRSLEGNFGTLFLMRYEKYFKNKELFLKLVNRQVPFLNGGLFECLDERGVGEKKDERVWIDGFSDNLPKPHQLIVPDYLFFGIEEKVDLSKEYGVINKGTKEAAVKGLINILKSYKFTITENTPIEEDVALDPELLGKVFENLLASYNPETKTTARKQTGSFYTPREIVGFMVNESLIGYLKNKIQKEDTFFLEFENKQTNLLNSEDNYIYQKELSDSNLAENETRLDTLLHELFSYNSENPFKNYPNTTEVILKHLDQCTILDPACGSGAFPMGILQKMVHVLQKLDPDNKVWKTVQENKAKKEAEEAFDIEDKQTREERLLEINEAFDQSINDPDYARKLFLIENCIYGVDIQPIATQISKLRFFISLVVDQKVNSSKDNFGIRPLPNLETKFVTANTLIDIDKQQIGHTINIFSGGKVDELEKELKKVRSKLFSARTKDTKLKYRLKDKNLRDSIAKQLKASDWGNDAADKLAKWDPYDQNASSSFFNSEWMFDIKDGFNIVIGNPPYILIQNIPNLSNSVRNKYLDYYSAQYKVDLYHLFIEKGIGLLSENGIISYITPNTFIKNKHNNKLREIIHESCSILSTVLFYTQVFENVSVDNLIFVYTKNKKFDKSNVYEIKKSINDITVPIRFFDQTKVISPEYIFNFDLDKSKEILVKKIEESTYELKKFGRAYFGIQTFDRNSFVSDSPGDGNWQPVIDGGNIFRYQLKKSTEFVLFEHKAIKSGGNPEVYKKSRIVVRQIGKFPEGVYCPPGIYTLNTIYNIFLNNNEIDLMFLLAVINSAVIKYYWSVTNFDNKETFPKIKKYPLETIPIKLSSSHMSVISPLVKLVSESQDSSRITLIEIIDALVLDLYFSVHMKEQEIDILDLVKEDIMEIFQGNILTKMNEIEKEVIMRKLYLKWSHPDNSVRNRIKLFAVRSPEILKPILES